MGTFIPPPPDELDRLPQVTILQPGAQLHEGQTYLDLDDLATGPFRARGMIVAGERDRLVSQRETDAETWRRLVELSLRAAL